MSGTSFLIAANVAVWLGLAGYLVFMAGKAAGIERRIRQLEVMGDDNGS